MGEVGRGIQEEWWVGSETAFTVLPLKGCLQRKSESFGYNLADYCHYRFAGLLLCDCETIAR